MVDLSSSQILFELVAFGMAFTPAIAKEIGKQHRWTCEQTGRRFQDGWLLDMAHRDHDRSQPYYNEPRNGRPLCRTAHLEEHIRRWIGFGDISDKYAVKLLAQRCWGYIDDSGNIKEGLHTYRVYNRNPEVLDTDRQEVISMFDRYMLDAREYIDFESNKPIPNDLNLW